MKKGLNYFWIFSFLGLSIVLSSCYKKIYHSDRKVQDYEWINKVGPLDYLSFINDSIFVYKRIPSVYDGGYLDSTVGTYKQIGGWIKLQKYPKPVIVEEYYDPSRKNITYKIIDTINITTNYTYILDENMRGRKLLNNEGKSFFFKNNELIQNSQNKELICFDLSINRGLNSYFYKHWLRNKKSNVFIIKINFDLNNYDYINIPKNYLQLNNNTLLTYKKYKKFRLYKKNKST